MPATTYVGSELTLFAAASCWKRYFASHLRPFLRGRILEVGAGIGGSTVFLCRQPASWVCLEPDPAQARLIDEKIVRGELPAGCTVRVGTIDDLADDDLFDTMLYLDVLEHIADDRGELVKAVRRLRPGGCLAVLGPAHESLSSPMDRALEHFRRYDHRSLARAAPAELRLVAMRYLDSVGMLASLANRWMLRQTVATPWQIAVWDKVFVRCSRCLDPLTGYSLGKSILAIWQRAAT